MAKRVAYVVDLEGCMLEFPGCRIAVHDGVLHVLGEDGPFHWFNASQWKQAIVDTEKDE